MLSVTNIFIILSFFSTLIVTMYPELYVFGLNDLFLTENNFVYFFLQILVFNFIHTGLFHFISTALLLFYFGNEVEKMVKDTKYLLFFVLTTVLVIFATFLWGKENMVGITAFCTATITYYTLELYRRGNQNYRGGLTALIVYFAFGFLPDISLFMIVLGIISGVAFFQMNKKFLK